MTDFHYRIDNTSHDGTDYVVFQFDKKLTRRQFDAYVKKAAVNALKYLIDRPDQVPYFGHDKGEVWFGDIYNRIVEEMEQFGFRPVEYRAVYEGWWSSPVWDGLKIPKRLKQRALETSKGLYKGLHEKHEEQTTASAIDEKS